MTGQAGPETAFDRDLETRVALVRRVEVNEHLREELGHLKEAQKRRAAERLDELIDTASALEKQVALQIVIRNAPFMFRRGRLLEKRPTLAWTACRAAGETVAILGAAIGTISICVGVLWALSGSGPAMGAVVRAVAMFGVASAAGRALWLRGWRPAREGDGRTALLLSELLDHAAARLEAEREGLEDQRKKLAGGSLADAALERIASAANGAALSEGATESTTEGHHD